MFPEVKYFEDVPTDDAVGGWSFCKFDNFKSLKENKGNFVSEHVFGIACNSQ